MSTPESSNSNPGAGTDDALVGISEIARMSSPPVFEQTVANWRKRFPNFPKPEQPPPGEPLWRASTIKEWLAATENERAPKVISFINLKGGVAKTTASVAVAEMPAATHGKWVLFIDVTQHAGPDLASGRRLPARPPSRARPDTRSGPTKFCRLRNISY
jgi:hypothetical protein